MSKKLDQLECDVELACHEAQMALDMAAMHARCVMVGIEKLRDELDEMEPVGVDVALSNLAHNGQKAYTEKTAAYAKLGIWANAKKRHTRAAKREEKKQKEEEHKCS